MSCFLIGHIQDSKTYKHSATRFYKKKKIKKLKLCSIKETQKPGCSETTEIWFN